MGFGVQLDGVVGPAPLLQRRTTPDGPSLAPARGAVVVPGGLAALGGPLGQRLGSASTQVRPMISASSAFMSDSAASHFALAAV